MKKIVKEEIKFFNLISSFLFAFFLFFMYNNKGNRYYLLRKRVGYGTNWEKRLY